MPYNNVMALIFILIAIYLLLKNSSSTVSVMSGLASSSSKVISTLQGSSTASVA